MYSVRVEAEFAAAHFLSSYRGKCEQLHGHNYLIRLWAEGEGLDGGGMLVDFALLKDILRRICAALDHTCLNDNPVFDNNPSAERISRYIFEEAVRLLPPPEAALLSAAEVFETPSSMARYVPGDDNS
jgi:6-pyruvoyltetrahydropterin/6-carboxytetrahydropterin synthase